VDNIAAEVDPNTRSIAVRIVVDNPGEFLKRRCMCRSGSDDRQESAGLLLPVSAILHDDENLPYVYVEQPDGSFARAHVTLGYRSGDRIKHPQRRAPGPACRDRRRPVSPVHAAAMSDSAPPPAAPESLPPPPRSIMNRLVASSLHQPLLIFLMTALLLGLGIRSLDRLPVDAYPDLSPPMVELITQWPGHSSEEVERLITVPVERGVNGIPRMTALRSISLYGLSDVIMTFRTAPTIISPGSRSQRHSGHHPAERHHAVGLADVEPVRPDLPLCAAKPRSLADGAEDLRRLDGRAAIPLGARRGG
jgi:hypothetical protein